MKITEMIAVADENKKTYECEYGTYNIDTGFVFNHKGRLLGTSELVNALVHEDNWKIKTEKKKMTLDEINKALGYEVEIVSNDDFINTLRKVGLL